MKTLTIFFIQCYRAVGSPWLGGACRFSPSCSAYAIEAVRRHGAFHGLRLALGRLLRCRPFYPGPHYDPVPLSSVAREPAP